MGHEVEHQTDFFEGDGYKTRKYDFFSAQLDVIAEKSGVALNTARKAIVALRDIELLQECADTQQVFKIFNKPVWDDETGKSQRWSYDRGYLNQSLKKTQPQETAFARKIKGLSEA